MHASTLSKNNVEDLNVGFLKEKLMKQKQCCQAYGNSRLELILAAVHKHRAVLSENILSQCYNLHLDGGAWRGAASTWTC